MVQCVTKYEVTCSVSGKAHINDLRHTSLTLRNSLIQWLRTGGNRPFSIIDEILTISKIIEETTLTREKTGWLESYYKRQLVNKYFDEGADYGHQYRLPNKTNNFKAFGRKTDFVKDAAITMVLEMYEQDQINRQEMIHEIGKESKEVVEGYQLVDLGELDERVTCNLKALK